MSSMTIGDLVGYIRADGSDFERGIARSQLRMEGFRLDTAGRLRDLSGRFIRESEVMGNALADGFSDAERAGTRIVTVYSSVADAQSRTMRARFARLREEAGRLGTSLAGMVNRVAERVGALDFSRLAAAGPAIGGVAMSIGAVAGRLGAAVPVAAGLAATVGNIAPAAAVAVTGLIAVQLASKALKIGMQGVGDAVSAAMDPSDPQAYAEALKKLSPNARAFVGQIRTMQPAFKGLQQAVQDRLFKGLDGTLKAMGKHTLPVLRTGLTNSAGALNGMAKGIGSAAVGLGRSGTLGQAIQGANAGLANMASIPGQVVTGLVQIGAAAAPAFSHLTGWAGDAFTGLSEKMTAAFNSGGMRRAIEQAIVVIGDLVDVARNVFSIVGSIFSAANASGGSFIQVLQQITGALADAFASPAVQAGLRAIFETVATLARTAAPLLASALSALGPVFAALGPPAQVLIKALGAALGPIIAALGPVLQAAAKAVGALVVALSPLLPVIGQLVAALLPALSPMLAAITSVFVALAPVVQQVATMLGSTLQPVIKGLSSVMVELVEQGAAQALSMLQMLIPVVPVLAPLFVQLGQSVGQVLTAIAPLLPQITLLGVQLVSALLPAILPLLPVLVQLASLWLRLATGVITNVVVPAISGIVAILAGLQTALQPAIAAVTWLTQGIADAFSWLYNLLVGNSIIPDLVNAIVWWFAGLPGKALSALGGLVSAVAGPARTAASQMITAVRDGVAKAVEWVRGLPGRAGRALGNIGSTLYNSGRSLVQGFINGITSRAGDIANAVSSIVSKARDFFPFSPAKTGPFSGKGWVLYSGQSIGQALAAGITGEQATVAHAAGGMLAAAQQALGAGLALPGAGMPGLAMAGAGATAGAAGERRIVLEIRSDGGRYGDFLTEEIRSRADLLGGGDVQRAFGKR
ncbi:hypothetical protein ACH4E8_29415 [Streptomyces sp. NPDC017979]|uniref:hypothetical protein n=1 Tax=Streptomyces sp. NPDC017979 TaxID=3365024 RepID=UPI0037A89766